MMITIRSTLWLTFRQLRSLVRQPWYVVAVVLQPILWLFLYGQLLGRMTEIPGFGAASYISFLTPGVIIMTTVMAAGWNGMGIIAEMKHGALHRFMVLPIGRASIVLGRVFAVGIVTVVQAVILLIAGVMMGAHFGGGPAGIAELLLAAVLLAMSVAALSNALGFALRREESLIGIANFLLLPLTFMSPAFMARSMMPRWIQVASSANPLSWGVEAARSAVSGTDSGLLVALRLSMLLAFCALASLLTAAAYRGYARDL